ncbi:MAG: LD-carboxypeptidase [Planctomycetota bacterium]
MRKPAIYLASVAGSCYELLESLGCASAADLVAFVQSAVGDGYRVEGDAALIEAETDGRHGRSDDAERAKAIEGRLADDGTAAFVALRGGAWLTRTLGQIDFEVLKRRCRLIAMFGFSELTTLLNIASAYPQAFCLYDLGPAFIRDGLRDYARRHPDELTEAGADQRFPQEFAAFFQDVRSILEGRGSRRSITGTLVAGASPGRVYTRFVGGNLAVLTTLLGTPYASALDPRGRWLALEDINESPERIDRRLAHLKLAGFFEHCAGLLIGDFHDQDRDHQETVLELLRYHLVPERDLPIITTRDVGHVWPLAPLPLNWPVTLERVGVEGDKPRVRFIVDWPGSDLDPEGQSSSSSSGSGS